MLDLVIALLDLELKVITLGLILERAWKLFEEVHKVFTIGLKAEFFKLALVGAKVIDVKRGLWNLQEILFSDLRIPIVEVLLDTILIDHSLEESMSDFTSSGGSDFEVELNIHLSLVVSVVFMFFSVDKLTEMLMFLGDVLQEQSESHSIQDVWLAYRVNMIIVYLHH